MTEPFFQPPAIPQILAGPPGRRVLVFSPHPDDETLALGGTIRLHALRGDPIRIVEVTDGGSGDPDGHYDPDAYGAIRRKEAVAALALLGVDDVRFWGYPDGYEARWEDVDVLVPRIVREIEELEPDLVYAPGPDEVHADHWVVSRLCRLALARMRTPPRAVAYEAWAALRPDYLIDVTEVYETKIAALRCYASQLRYQDYERVVRGLNTYRSLILPGKDRLAEAFADLSPEEDPR